MDSKIYNRIQAADKVLVLENDNYIFGELNKNQSVSLYITNGKKVSFIGSLNTEGVLRTQRSYVKHRLRKFDAFAFSRMLLEYIKIIELEITDLPTHIDPEGKGFYMFEVGDAIPYFIYRTFKGYEEQAFISMERLEEFFRIKPW